MPSLALRNLIMVAKWSKFSAWKISGIFAMIGKSIDAMIMCVFESPPCLKNQLVRGELTM